MGCPATTCDVLQVASSRPYAVPTACPPRRLNTCNAELVTACLDIVCATKIMPRDEFAREVIDGVLDHAERVYAWPLDHSLKDGVAYAGLCIAILRDSP